MNSEKRDCLNFAFGLFIGFSLTVVVLLTIHVFSDKRAHQEPKIHHKTMCINGWKYAYDGEYLAPILSHEWRGFIPCVESDI
jgi:hypothetical protein